MPAKADMTHKIKASISLQVGGASTSADRIGSSFSISGSGVGDQRLTAPQQTPSQPEQSPLASTRQARLQLRKTLQAKLSFSQSYTQGDAVPTSAHYWCDCLISAASLVPPMVLQVTLQAPSPQMAAMTITAGGANTLAIGQLTTKLLLNRANDSVALLLIAAPAAAIPVVPNFNRAPLNLTQRRRPRSTRSSTLMSTALAMS